MSVLSHAKRTFPAVFLASAAVQLLLVLPLSEDSWEVLALQLLAVLVLGIVLLAFGVARLVRAVGPPASAASSSHRVRRVAYESISLFAAASLALLLIVALGFDVDLSPVPSLLAFWFVAALCCLAVARMRDAAADRTTAAHADNGGLEHAA